MVERGFSPTRSAAEGADEALNRYLQQSGQDAPRSAGLTRRIALVALYLHLRQGATLQTALDAAAGIHDGQARPSMGYLRNSKSEARAVSDAVMTSPALPHGKHGPNAFFARLDGLLDAISFDEANRSRAHALRGTRGGRRPKTHPQLVLQGLIRLKRRSDEGDASAADELAAIRDLLKNEA